MIYRDDDFPCELDIEWTHGGNHDFPCELDIEWTHGGNLFRMTCDDFIYEDFDRIQLFVYLPLSMDTRSGPPWVALQTNENFAEDFWDKGMKLANEHWEWQRDEAISAAANDASGC